MPGTPVYCFDPGNARALDILTWRLLKLAGLGVDITAELERLDELVQKSFTVNPNDGAQNARAIDELLLAIVGVAVGIAERNELLFPSIHGHLKNLATDFVTDNDEARRIPHRALRKTKAGCHRG